MRNFGHIENIEHKGVAARLARLGRRMLLVALACTIAGAGSAGAQGSREGAKSPRKATASARKATASSRKASTSGRKATRKAPRKARKARSARSSTASRELARFTALRGSRPKVQGTYYNTVARGVAFYDAMDEARAAIAAGKFVPLYGNQYYATYRMTLAYATPDARTFVETLAPQFVEHCDEMMVVTSALRPKEKSPRNGSPWTVHPTGIAVDIRKPRNRACWSWLRQRLLDYQAEGVVDATEEFHPPHFHIAVKKAPPPLTRTVETSNGEVIAVVR
ncbi:MAG TPA: DUF5715 family protein [Gemmatimonadaceae bacterium]